MLERLPAPSAPIIIELAGVPVCKGRPRFRRTKAFVQTYSDPRTVSYEGELRAAAAEAMAGRPPLERAVRVLIEALLPVPASWSAKKQAACLAREILPTVRPDVDNYLKAALDALNAVVFRDDNQVVSATVIKRYTDRPRLVVTVEAL